MVEPLLWKDGEGYDIHLLRGGPRSGALLSRLQPDTSPSAHDVVFSYALKGLPADLGLDIDLFTGEVTALAHRPAPQARFPNFNFLVVASQNVGQVRDLITRIRIHIHDTIQSVWLTPQTLSPHVDVDECRLTVLALFDDGTVGDITDWPPPQLTWKSATPAALEVLPRGVLKAKQANKTVTVTATVKLTKPPINKAPTATILTQPTWRNVGKAAKVEFVSGPLLPDPTDLDSPDPKSVKSVIAARPNVLFISEGFDDTQEQEFRQQVVELIVKNELNAQDYLQPFKLLKDSINYWSVFLASKEAGTTVLGEHAIEPTKGLATLLPLPIDPTPTATQWAVSQMIHQAGLPGPNDPPTADPAAWVADRQKVFDLPSGAPATPLIAQTEVDAWNALRTRTLLNERNTAFGMAHGDRPRASGQDSSPERLKFNPRRMSPASLKEFIGALVFGFSASQQVWGIGDTWMVPIVNGKDVGLVCFICRSERRAAMADAGADMAWFTASTGDKDQVPTQAGNPGRDLTIATPLVFSSPLLASLVAYGCGRSLGLEDEDGDGSGSAPGPTATVGGHNLQKEQNIVSTVGGTRTIDTKKMAWLWPRPVKAAAIEVKVDPLSGNVLSPVNCDQNGTPNPNGAFLLVSLPRPPGKPFIRGDVVRLRGAVQLSGSDLLWHSPSDDALAGFPFKVEKVGTGTLVLRRQTPTVPQLGYTSPPAGTLLNPANFQKVVLASLFSPRADSSGENKLVSRTVQTQLTKSNSPLNAPRGSQGQSCTRAPNANADVTATNLPLGLNLPSALPSKADLIGLYDGGGHYDCGVFRPAGRCRMRRKAHATTPFCQVCQYVLVDRLDPGMHPALDDIYDIVCPP